MVGAGRVRREWPASGRACPSSPATGFRCFLSASSPGSPRGVAPASWFRGFLAASTSCGPWGARMGRVRGVEVIAAWQVRLHPYLFGHGTIPWGDGRLRRPVVSPTEMLGGLTTASESFGAVPWGVPKGEGPCKTPAAVFGRLIAAPGAFGALVSHMNVALAHGLG